MVLLPVDLACLGRRARDTWRHYGAHGLHRLLPRRIARLRALEGPLVADVVKVVVDEVTLCVVVLHHDRRQVAGVVAVIIWIIRIYWCHSLVRIKHELRRLVEHLTRHLA